MLERDVYLDCLDGVFKLSIWVISLKDFMHLGLWFH